MTDTLNTTGDSARPVILGLGGEGVRIANALQTRGQLPWIRLIAMDTDRKMVEASSVQEKFCLNSDLTGHDGLGCGGNVMQGERALARVRSQIKQLLSGTPMLILVGGLGGGTCTGGIRTIASVARELRIPSFLLLTTPFSFESYTKRTNAEICIKELLTMTDILVSIPNDLLFSTLPPNTPAEQAFAAAADQMALSVLGIANILRSHDLLGTDYATFMAALHGRKSICGMGVGIASSQDGLDRCAIALQKMLASPFLAGMDNVNKSDAALLTLTAGPDLQISELKRLLEQAVNVLPKDIDLIAGANIANELSGRIQLSLLTIQYKDEQPNAATKRERQNKPDEPLFYPGTGQLVHEDLFDTTRYERGIFDSLPQTKQKGPDFDLPTFQRKSAFIDKGN